MNKTSPKLCRLQKQIRCNYNKTASVSCSWYKWRYCALPTRSVYYN